MRSGNFTACTVKLEPIIHPVSAVKLNDDFQKITFSKNFFKIQGSIGSLIDLKLIIRLRYQNIPTSTAVGISNDRQPLIIKISLSLSAPISPRIKLPKSACSFFFRQP